MFVDGCQRDAIFHHCQLCSRATVKTMIKRFFRPSGQKKVVFQLYDRIVKQAREPRFYLEYSVPDTVDGRFEMLSIHMFLVLRRLRRSPEDVSQALFDHMFEDMDLSLREMGAGDMGVGKRVKTMIQAFYGRVSSYEEGLQANGDLLEAALMRNVYGTVDEASGAAQILAQYVRTQDSYLRTIKLTEIETAQFEFGVFP